MAGIAEKHKLHDLCHNGKLRQVKEYLASDPNASTSINEQAGVFGYTPMHEAVSSKNDHILQLLLTYGGQVNALCNGKYTPLHIAASIGCVECIKILLEYNADISLVDEFGKTPFATAQLNKRKRAARVLKTAEIKRMAATEDLRLGKAIEILQCGKDVEQNCFEEALQIAVQRNNHKSVGYLVIHGAKNVEECLHAALLKPFLHQTAALLLLCHAAKNGDKTMIRHLCEGLKTTNFADDSNLDQISGTEVVLTRKYLPEKWNRRLTQRKLWDMRKAACTVDMAFPISIALNEGHFEVAKIIVFEKYCDQKRGEADWHGLALSNLRNCWIDEIKGYKKLVLAHNVLHSVPQNIINMKNLLRLDLSKNYIVEIPKEIFELPLLRNLNLSYNDITHLPRVNEWNKSMKILNLQANNLKTIDDSIDQSELEDLNLSENNLLSVADCICRIKTLTTLDISSNRLITVFPPELAKLSKLSFFGMRNMDQVTDPPPGLRATISGLLRHLRAKLRNSEAYYTMKLMIVGLANQGKTTLMHRLDKDFAFNQNQSTKGVEIKEIIISRARSFVFKFWDFAGQEEYYATHQCFLSQRSMYLLVWKVTDREKGIIGLKPWLDNLETRVPNSTVIIVGTHLDEIPEEEKAKGFEVEMNWKIFELLRTYKKISNPENSIIMVTCNAAVRECKEKIEKLRQLIYTVAENMTVTGAPNGPKIMGEMIPSSYLSLAKIIAKHQTELQEQNEMPILRKHQFEALVSENAKKNTKDIFDPDDVDIATKFLHDIGTILHYDDPNQDLRDLYFVNPSWLCELMAKVVTVKEAQSFIKDGILYRKDIEFIIGGDKDKFPKEFYSQYLRLLYRFQIACRLDEDRVLIPSQLPKDFPLEEARSIEPNHVLQRQHSFSCIPQGFWSRFIGRFLLYLKDMLTVNMDLKSDSINDLHPEPGMEVSGNSVTAEHYGVSQYELPSLIEKRQTFQSDKDVNDTKNAKEELSVAESKVISDVGGPIDISTETFNSEEAEKIESYQGKDDSHIEQDLDNFKDNVVEEISKLEEAEKIESYQGKDDSHIEQDLDSFKDNVVEEISKLEEAEKIESYQGKDDSHIEQDLNSFKDNVVEEISKLEEAEKIESYQGKDDSHIEQDLNSFKDNVVEEISKLEEAEKIESYQGKDDSHIEQDLNSFKDNVVEEISKLEEAEKIESYQGKDDSHIEQDLNSFKDNVVEEISKLEEAVKIESYQGKDDSHIEQDLNSFKDNVIEDISKLEEAEKIESYQGKDDSHIEQDLDSFKDNVVEEISKSEEAEKIESYQGKDDSHIEQDLDSFKDNVIEEVSKSEEAEKIESYQGKDDSHIEQDLDSFKDNVVEEISKLEEAEKIESYQGKDDSHIEQDLNSFKDNVIEDISKLEEEEKNNRNLNQGPKRDQSCTTESVKNVNDSTGARETDPEDITTRAVIRLMENGQVPFLLNNMIIETKSPPSVASSISLEEEYSVPTSREATPLSVPETFSSASSECSTPITSRPCSSAKEDRSQSLKMKHTTQRIEAITSLTDMHHCQIVQDECSNVDEAEFNEPVDVSYLLGKKYLRCWRKGILFSHPKLFLSVSVIPSNSDRQIIETRVSRNLLGYRALSFIVDHIRTLIKEWYPGLCGDNGLVPYVRQLVSCPTCTDFGFKPPFMFDISDCYRSSITQEYIICSKNHMPQTVSLRELCPDIMFMDLPSSLQLNPQDLSCFEAEDYLLGSGQFGKVYRGAYKGKPAAIKLSNFSGDESNLREALDNFYDVRQEVIILSKVKKHPYIISFLGVSVRPKLYSVMELATQGTLRKAIKGQMGHIKRIIIYRIAQQMASALSYLHQLGIVHRDLKSDNVLVFSTDPISEINAKLTDFGTADFMSCTGLKFCTGTPGFVAPEILEYSKKDEYTAKVDVYSFAMVLYESITKRRPFQDIAEDVLEISRQVKERKRPFFGDLELTTYGFLTLTELMMKAWDQEAMKRPSSYDIWQQLKSPSFCLLFGKISLGQIQSPRQLCFIAESSELWVCCDDKSGASIVVLDIANAKEKARFIPTLNKAKDSYYNVVHISLVDKSHVAVILRSTNDYVVIYSTNKKRCVDSYQVKDSYIKSLTVSENYVILGCEDGSFLRVTKKDFIRGKFKEKNTLVNEKRAISALVTSESSLFVGCDKYVYKYPLNFKQQESGTVEMEDMRSGNEKQHVERMMVSPDGLMLFISFRGSPIITCRLVENMNSLGDVDCSDVVKILVPHSDVYDQRVTCFCVQMDTLWIGTGSGHVLIYGIRVDCAPSFISWLHPYNLEVRCMISCNSVGSENFMVTIGKELNPEGLSHHMQGLCQLNMTFPVDESLLKKKPRGKKEDKKELVPEDSAPGRKNVLLVWDAVDAATLTRISSLQ